MRKVLEKLKIINLKLYPSKYNLFRHESVILDMSNLLKIFDQIIRKYLQLQMESLRRYILTVKFLVFCTYYKIIAKGFSSIARSFQILPETNRKFPWTYEHEGA